MSSIKQDYQDLVLAMRELGSALIPATAVQFEAPPASGATKEKNERGIKNPTLEIVLDPRRADLSTEITATSSALRQARALLAPHVPALRSAVARWEGTLEGTPA